MTAATDLATMLRCLRMSRGQSRAEFYEGRSRNWSFRLENPDAVQPGSGKHYGPVLSQKVLDVLDREGITFAPRRETVGCIFAAIHGAPDLTTDEKDLLARVVEAMMQQFAERRREVA